MISIGIRIANLVQNILISNYYALLLDRRLGKFLSWHSVTTVKLSIKILKKGLFYFSQKEEKQEEANTEKEKKKEAKPALFFFPLPSFWLFKWQESKEINAQKQN